MKVNKETLGSRRKKLSPSSFMKEKVVGDSQFSAVVDGCENIDRARNELIDAILAAMR